VISFITIVLRAWNIPFSHDETATFFYYIQSDNYLPYRSHAYTNNHVLNSALANLFYHGFGSHPFVLRLPNILSFLLLCFGVKQLLAFFKQIGSKYLMIVLFLLTFCFLDIFVLCRGYGLSIACMLCGLVYVLQYFQTKDFRKVFTSLVFIQLALAANLTLLPAIFCIAFIIIIFQFTQNVFFVAKTIGFWLVHGIIFGFWIKLTLFYKAQGLLDSGKPYDYWNTSFVSLIEFIFGSKIGLIQVVCITTTGFILIASFYAWRKERFKARYFFTPTGLFSFSFFAMIVGFWLLNLFIGINYPEDRTGLFYFLFFALSVSFAWDVISEKVGLYVSVTLTVISLIYFARLFNLTSFTSYFYHTMPLSVFEKLKEEQARVPSPFTVGGNAARELNYAFLNYQSEYSLNPMNIENTLQLNTDYIFAHEYERPYYQELYEELAYDKEWNRVLIKRKTPIQHETIRRYNVPLIVNNENEFNNLFQIQDTSFSSKNPLEAEIVLQFKEVPKPFNAFLVLSFTDKKNERNDYRRIYLNWAGKSLINKELAVKLTTTNLPDSISNIVAYIWNIEKKPVQIHCKSVHLYQLRGKGVNFIVPESFYPIMGNITKEVQL
jgi:hypothetical protein